MSELVVVVASAHQRVGAIAADQVIVSSATY